MKKLLCITIICLVVSPLYAISIAVIGNNSNTDISTFLTSKGHIVTNMQSTLPSNLSGYQAVILLRMAGNDVIKNFVLGGGKLITEWDSSDWALNTAGLLNANINGGGYIGSGIGITINSTGLSLGLGTGIANPYSDPERTDFFRTFSSIGTGANVLATYNGSSAAIVGGQSGLGYTMVMAYDWADGFASSNAYTRQLLLNALNVNVTPVPEPSILCLLGLGISILALKKRKN